MDVSGGTEIARLATPDRQAYFELPEGITGPVCQSEVRRLSQNVQTVPDTFFRPGQFVPEKSVQPDTFKKVSSRTLFYPDTFFVTVRSAMGDSQVRVRKIPS